MFRILFGGVMVYAVGRFWIKGWIDELYVDPVFHFTYFGFGWVRPWPAWGMYLHFGVMGLAALGVLLGLRTQAAALVFFVTFTYAELIEKAAYLNHYYLVSLIAFLLVFVPSGAAWSVDARRDSRKRDGGVVCWHYVALRCQVALVYVYAGLAKVDADWLLKGEPLGTWLQAYADVPVAGPLLAAPGTALFMSWFGALFDLTIVGWLIWSRTRLVAYAVAVVFHVTIWLLFPVGVFSWVMLVCATLFFEAAWPARAMRGRSTRPVVPHRSGRYRHRLDRKQAWVLGGFVLVQALLPVRYLLYPGRVNWREEGFRFAWRVMLIEKTGQVEFEVVTGADKHRSRVFPRKELTRLQYQMMSTQPDMIHQYAQEIAARLRNNGHRQIRVYAHAWASLNGRPSQRFIDPGVDLAAEPRGWGAKAWILPLENRGQDLGWDPG